MYRFGCFCEYILLSNKAFMPILKKTPLKIEHFKPCLKL